MISLLGNIVYFENGCLDECLILYLDERANQKKNNKIIDKKLKI
jgi:hypothetical protein